METVFVNNYVNLDAEQQLSALIKMRESWENPVGW